MTLKLAIASDHAGYIFKQALISSTQNLKIEWLDLGTHSQDSVDYPDYAQKLAYAIQEGQVKKGVLICGTGIGISIAANRFKHIRAALVHDITTTKACRQHNDANVICFGARIIGPLVAAECLEVFIKTEFEGGRHAGRVTKLTTCG